MLMARSGQPWPANLVPDYWSSPDLRGFAPPSTLAVKRTNTFPHIGHSAPESGLWAPSDRSMCSTAAKARVPFFGFCVRLTGSGIQAGQLGLTVPPPTMCPAGENRSRAAPGVMPSAGRQRVGRARQFAGRLRGRSGARLLRQSRQPAGYRDSVQ